jgi:hypothetical protein
MDNVQKNAITDYNASCQNPLDLINIIRLAVNIPYESKNLVKFLQPSLTHRFTIHNPIIYRWLHQFRNEILEHVASKVHSMGNMFKVHVALSSKTIN